VSAPTTTISDVGTVAVTVSDQDRALAFYVDTLGFEKRLDVPMPGGGRWLTVAPPGAAVSVALTAGTGAAVGTDTGIRFVVGDAAAEHTSLVDRKVDVDAVIEWPGVPPMFTFRDSDGNTLYVFEASS
jgi:lactoylglutathione lyase